MNYNPTTAYEEYCLGEAYEEGKYGCPLDLEKAIYWFTKAAEHGTEDDIGCAGIVALNRVKDSVARKRINAQKK